jgi:hypothetical protein
MDLTVLLAAQPGLLQRAAGDWESAGSRLGRLSAEFRTQTEALFDGSWVGSAADAASTNLSALLSGLTAMTEDMAAMAAVYRDAAMGVSDAQALLRAAEDLAASNGLVIGAGGDVSLAAPVVAGAGARMAAGEAMITAMPPAAGEVADLVARALALAGEVDNQVSAQLGRLPGSAAAVAAADRLAGELGREMMPPPGLSPEETHDWWQALNTAAQQQLIHEFPAQIGWMNGLPATARNEANRLAMHEEQASLERELAGLQAYPPPAVDYLGAKVGYVPNPAYEEWQAKIAGIEHELAGISSLEQALALGGTHGLPAAYLLGFGTSGIGQAIVAFGDPDAAATTVTYVPGVGTTLTSALGNSQRAAALWQQAHRFDPGMSLSSIFWLDYNAPQTSLTDIMTDLQIGSTADAVAGARSLAGFQAGLAAAHVAGVPDRTVLLGHSYGTLVVGEAAAHDGVHPDDIIFVGSPGVGVNQAAQLGIPASHVWAGANVNDPVPDIPPDAMQQLPSVVEYGVTGGIGGLVTGGVHGMKVDAEVDAVLPLLIAHGEDLSAGFFGTNPATPAFGGNDFSADYIPGEPSTFDLNYFLTFKAHSSYWDPSSASLLNMAHIVDGEYSQVMLAPASPAGSGG